MRGSMTREELICSGIRAEVKDILHDIKSLQEKLVGFQDICPHVNAIGSYHSSSGNYDPSNDIEYYEHECPDCGKRWTEVA